eukprot:TRINITY_DN102093_c0_g1_i1.p1 TRINITY_DN102093_c0_g1~~TRINITY_DN102093_c0_g1_i1.p1  ORF type:complete len:317 (-),score=47.75 TRINITY_DN102093_c0_g1_i1:77-946(-)
MDDLPQPSLDAEARVERERAILSHAIQEAQVSDMMDGPVVSVEVPAPAGEHLQQHAYGMDESVEYLSKSRGAFLAGRIVGVSTLDEDGLPCYDVLLWGGQIRRAVQLSLLRRPLVPGREYISLLVEDKDGVILQDGEVALVRESTARAMHQWRAAVLLERLPAHLVGICYRMSYKRDRAVLVPATYVRREFPAGLDVEVYLGLAEGWVAGRVLPAETAEEKLEAGHGSPLPKSSESESDTSYLLPAPDSSALMNEQWPDIRVQQIDAQGERRTVILPAYLIRTPTFMEL